MTSSFIEFRSHFFVTWMKFASVNRVQLTHTHTFFEKVFDEMAQFFSRCFNQHP